MYFFVVMILCCCSVVLQNLDSLKEMVPLKKTKKVQHFHMTILDPLFNNNHNKSAPPRKRKKGKIIKSKRVKKGHLLINDVVLQWR